MNGKIKLKWVKALRSKQYKQGRMSLRASDNTYCCLGVLASVMGCRWRRHSDEYFIAGPIQDIWRQGNSLQQDKQEQAGLTYRIQKTLIKKNDGEWSFEKIASWIEKKL